MRELFVKRARRTAAGVAMLVMAAPAAAQRAPKTSPPDTAPAPGTAIIPALDGALVITVQARHAATDVSPYLKRAQDAVYQLDSIVASTDSMADVVRINRAAGEAPVAVSPDVIGLLGVARRSWRVSDHLLDPTSVPLVQSLERRERLPVVPSAAEQDSIRALVDFSAVEIDGAASTVRLPRAGMQIDLSLMARGRGVDVARKAFPASAFLGGVIQSGSNALAFGRPPHGDKWRIQIVAPGVEGRVLGIAIIDSGAVMIASDSARSRPDPRHPVRLVDARTGELPTATASVIVIAPTAEYANATAAALYMLPPSRALAVADSMGIAAVIVRRLASGKPAGPSNVLVSRRARRLIEFAPASLRSARPGRGLR